MNEESNLYLNLIIRAHAAEDENDPTNLSQSRADSLRQLFIDSGVMSSRIITLFYGSNWPIATSESSNGLSGNRRAEFELCCDSYNTCMEKEKSIRKWLSEFSKTNDDQQ